MRRVVAEITAENLELKKTIGLEGRVRLSAQKKQEVLDLVERTQRRSEWPLEAILYYFLLSFVDTYSRYVVHHRLLMELHGKAVASELEAALRYLISAFFGNDHMTRCVGVDAASW
jgi:hypothetical protein